MHTDPDFLEGFEDGKKVQLSTGLIVATFPYNQNFKTYTAEDFDKNISRINSLSEIYPRARGLTQIKDDLVAHQNLLSSKSPEKSPSDFNLEPIFGNDDTHRNEIDRLDRFETAEGTIFTDIISINSDPGGITIMHVGGVSRVAYAELTREQRAQFKLSKEGADIYAEREKDERTRREKQEQARIQSKNILEKYQGKFPLVIDNIYLGMQYNEYKARYPSSEKSDSSGPVKVSDAQAYRVKTESGYNVISVFDSTGSNVANSMLIYEHFRSDRYNNEMQGLVLIRVSDNFGQPKQAGAFIIWKAPSEDIAINMIILGKTATLTVVDRKATDLKPADAP